MELKDVLIQERKNKGLTQKELAKELCVSIQTINNWERGKTLPDAVNLLNLSTFFSVDFVNFKNYQFDYQGEKPKKSIFHGLFKYIKSNI